jgi:DNA-binding transcriptional LysR family regulator
MALSPDIDSEVSESIESGAWDFAFVLHGQPSPFPEPLTVTPVMTFESGVYAATAHPLARRRRVAPRDMAAFDWLVSSLSMGASYLPRTFEKARTPTPRIRALSNSFSLIKALLAWYTPAAPC